MKTTISFLLFTLLAGVAAPEALAQQPEKTRVFGEAGLGFGQTLLFGDVKQRLVQSLGGSFKPGVGNNLTMGFYLAPQKWKGLGIGSRIKGTFGTSVQGENDSDRYLINYYNLALSAKYYPFSRVYNRGFYGRGSVGFGQFTAKRLNETTHQYVHQYGIGSTLMMGLGYSVPSGEPV
jgi:hypothetical protein